MLHRLIIVPWILVTVITLAAKAKGICSESTFSMPLAEMQHITAGERTIEYEINPMLVTTEYSWCIGGLYARDSRYNKFDHQGARHVLQYTNPDPSDRANGLSLYVMDAEHQDCDNTTGLKLLSIQSSLGTISAPIVLLNIVEATCLLPTHPVNGQVEIDDKTAVYSCNTGFTLSGNESRYCRTTDFGQLQGAWSGAPPTCEPIECQKPEIANGTITVENCLLQNRVPFGVLVTFNCTDGYSLTGTSTLTCGHGDNSSTIGNWSGDFPTCAQIQSSNTMEPQRTTSTHLPSTSSSINLSTTPEPSPTASPSIVTQPHLGPRVGDSNGILIIFVALILGLVLGTFAASFVSIVCCKRTQKKSAPVNLVQTNVNTHSDQEIEVPDDIKTKV